MMRSIYKKVAIASAASVAAIGLTVGPAAAATVSGGPSFTASSTNSALASGSITIHCTSSSASGAAVPGTGLTVAANITGLSFTGCTAFGVPATVTTTASTSNPWPLTVSTVTSTGATGTVSNVGATITVPSLGCTVTVSGSTPGTWNNNQTLSFTGGSGLTTSSSGFCIGIGSTGNFTGNYAVTASPAIIIS